jgi:hypothetical protein
MPACCLYNTGQKYNTPTLTGIFIPIPVSRNYGRWLYQKHINLNQIIKLADAQANTNYKGVALVLRSWVFTLLTDAYGRYPVYPGIQHQTILTPAYDAQKDVYFALLDDLKTAQAALESGPSYSGDVLYGNNIASWKKFANSLRCVLR